MAVFKERLKLVRTYEAGKPIELVMREYGIVENDIIKLGSNENPYGTSPLVVESLKQNSHKAYLYPDDSMHELKDALAKHFNISQKELIIGAGSDQIIEFCMHSLEHHNARVLMAGITFAMYEVYAKLAGAEICKTQSDEHKLAEMENLYYESIRSGKRVSAIFLCMPNNPLGECLDVSAVEDFISKIDKDTLVVIDGAYQEFAAYKDKAKAITPSQFIKKFSNVVYLGTFSKIYGLGGMRVGYGIANEHIVSMLYKVRPPFNVSSLSLQAALVALGDKEFVAKCIESNAKEMKRYEAYAKESGWEFIDSYGNFITFSHADIESANLCEWLLQRGVIVRNLNSYGMNAIRITIGNSSQNTRVLELMQDYLQTHN